MTTGKDEPGRVLERLTVGCHRVQLRKILDPIRFRSADLAGYVTGVLTLRTDVTRGD